MLTKLILMKNGVISFFVSIALLLLNACSGIKVVSDVDPAIDWSQFSTYQYYGWEEESDKILTRFDKERIENAFGSEFTKRGLDK
ncbi:unnamed protein product, partial [marine sediment metagenome]